MLYHGFTGMPGWRGPQQDLPLRLVGFGELINGTGLDREPGYFPRSYWFSGPEALSLRGKEKGSEGEKNVRTFRAGQVD